jgi:hypothetical protein
MRLLKNFKGEFLLKKIYWTKEISICCRILGRLFVLAKNK